MEQTNRSVESEGFRAHVYLSTHPKRRSRWKYVASSKLTKVLVEEDPVWKTARLAHEQGHYSLPNQLVLEFSLEQVFRSLANQWREDTEHVSNINKAIAHPAYQQIIGMGKAVGSEILPLLLRELQERPDHWFRALVEITGVDPAFEEETFDGAVRSWLDWGKRRGHLIHARSAA
jgi:hypothetical protein